MIWATVSSRSCFCWLYTASPSLAVKNILNLILLLTTWWCLCVVFSCIVGRGCLLWPVHFVGKTPLAFALLHSTPRPNLPVTPGISWLPTFAFQSTVMKKTSCNVFIEPFNFSFFSITGRDIDLDYHGVEWFALETNRDHSVIFETAHKHCILDSCWLWGLLLFF